MGLTINYDWEVPRKRIETMGNNKKMNERIMVLLSILSRPKWQISDFIFKGYCDGWIYLEVDFIKWEKHV